MRVTATAAGPRRRGPTQAGASMRGIGRHRCRACLRLGDGGCDYRATLEHGSGEGIYESLGSGATVYIGHGVYRVACPNPRSGAYQLDQRAGRRACRRRPGRAHATPSCSCGRLGPRRRGDPMMMNCVSSWMRSCRDRAEIAPRSHLLRELVQQHAERPPVRTDLAQTAGTEYDGGFLCSSRRILLFISTNSLVHLRTDRVCWRGAVLAIAREGDLRRHVERGT